jgi:hypothetical protein
LRTLVSISATGSVNLIVCFSSRHPFAPHSPENPQRLAYQSLDHASSACHPERDAFCLAKDLPLHESGSSLPGRLRHSRNLPEQRQLPEAHPAQTKLPQISPRSPAALAAIVLARGKLRFPYLRWTLSLLSAVLNPLCHCCHVYLSTPSYPLPASRNLGT